MDKGLMKIINKLKSTEGKHHVTSSMIYKNYVRQVNTVAKFSPNAKKILDIGCGNGYPTAILYNKFKKSDIIGIDIDKRDAWQTINEAYPIQFQTYNGKDIPFKNKTFDVVVLFGVLEHINENKQDNKIETELLKEILRVLKPHGYLFIFNLPNEKSIKEKLCKMLGLWHHKKRFTRERINSLLKNSKYKIKDIRLYGILPAGGGPAGPLIPFLNLFAWFIDLEEELPEFSFAESFDVIAQKNS